MSACERGGQWRSALTLCSAMLGRRLVPDGVCVGTAASAVKKALGSSPAFKLLGHMVSLWPTRVAGSDDQLLAGSICSPASLQSGSAESVDDHQFPRPCASGGSESTN